ncbi:MAG: sodium:solute symporter family protein [Fervidicoccus fontis]
MNVFIIYFLIYAIIGTAIAVASKRVGIKSARDYYIGGRKIGGILAGATYAATTYSAFMMIGLVGMAYSTGVGTLGFELSYLLSTVAILSTVGYEIWKISKERQWISPSQMLGDLYGSIFLSKFIALLYIFAMIPYIAAQIQGLGVIFQIGGMSYESGVVAAAVIVALWIAIAGMWSVATTDLYQAILMLGGGILFLYVVISMILPFGGSLRAIEVLASSGYLGIMPFWSFPVFLSYTLPWIFFAITNPQVVSRLFIQRDEKSYKMSVTFFAAFGLLYTLLAVMIGLFARYLAINGIIPSGLGGNYVTPAILSKLSAIAAGFIGISIIAAAISTADGIILSVSSAIFKDLLGLKDKKVELIATIDVVLTVVASILAYLHPAYIVDLSVMTSLLLLPLAPVTIAGIAFKNKLGKFSRASSLASIISGVTIGVYGLYANGARRIFTSMLCGLPTSLWVLLISCFVIVIGIYLDYQSKLKRHILDLK